MIHKTFGCSRFVYNYFLNECKINGYKKAYDMCKDIKELEKKYANPKEIEQWESCRNENDRDMNASINIMLKGLRFHYRN